jgi:dephospho-CoA kinase
MDNSKKQILIGVTGGIGSGKTYVSNRLAKKGFKVFYADLIAKQLYLKDKTLVKKLVTAFSKEILNFKGKINLLKFKEIIFSSKKNYEKANSIVHPVVISYVKNQIKKTPHRIVLVEAALVFETGFDKYVDYVITVFTNKKKRIERIMLRDGAKRSEVEKILRFQMDEKSKLKKSNFIILNNKDLPYLDIQIDFIAKMLKLL